MNNRAFCLPRVLPARCLIEVRFTPKLSYTIYTLYLVLKYQNFYAMLPQVMRTNTQDVAIKNKY